MLSTVLISNNNLMEVLKTNKDKAIMINSLSFQDLDLNKIKEKHLVNPLSNYLPMPKQCTAKIKIKHNPNKI